MAASVAKRQFGHPPPIAGRAPESPDRGFGFSPFVSANDHRDDYNSDDDDDDNETDPWWKPLCISSGGGIGLEPSIRDPRDVGTSDSWVERNPSLIRLTGKHPFNSEPPLASLMAHGFITPSPLHYVRNHGAVPRAEWSTWTVDITGLVRRPLRLSLDQLVNGFPALEIPVTLVCAGNRRKEQNMSRQTVGFNWGSAAVSTSVWRGARLRDVLRRCGAMRRGAYVSFEGAEDLPGGGGSKYGTSLRREAAMDPSNDVMLAYMQNGELLSPDHGFPVRLIIPGFIGGRMVKWLKRVIVTADESDSHYHYRDNRVLPPHVLDADLANSEAWWYKPEYIINELNINSVITSPSHDEILPINSFTTQRPYTMKGYAYSGGGKKVTRVEITLDGGDSWRVCSVDHPERPNKYGKYWCWCFWSVELEVLDLLGAKEIAVRAWDSTHNTQPEKLIWNLMGMMNNCWFRVRVNVCRPHQGEVGLVFEHPTQPGNLDGGWMARQKEPPSLKKSLSSPLMNTSATDSRHSMSEVQRHSTRDSAWIVVNGHVYDCTSFIKDHPGGADSILINAGTDCTQEFEAIHSNRAKSMLDTYLIGELIPDARLDTIHEAPTTGIKPPVHIALSNPRERVPVRLVAKTAVSRVVRRFRFALPSAHNLLGLPVGKHIFLCASIDGKLCMRAYTPTSPVDEVGYLDLLVKVYMKGENPRFPEGGLMSQHLDSLPLGAPLEIKGPIGHIEYAGRGNFLIDGKTRFARRLAMIAGGTGITPVWQVIQAVMRDQPEDRTEMHVVYANQTEDDVLLREELDRCVGESHGRLRVWYVVSKPRRPQEWPYGVGSVNEGVLREHVMLGGDDETLAFACGPPGLIQSAVLPNLEKMGYDVAKSCFLF